MGTGSSKYEQASQEEIKETLRETEEAETESSIRKKMLAPTSTTLIFWRKKITDKEGVQIAEELKANINLRTLDLSENYLGDPTAIKLAEALQYNNTLTELDLRSNRITAQGAAALAAVLTLDEGPGVNTTLRLLKINENWFGKRFDEKQIFWLCNGRVHWRAIHLNHTDLERRQEREWWKELMKQSYLEAFLGHAGDIYGDLLAIIIEYLVEP